MKLVEHFNDFLANTVNLNDTRVQQLEDSIAALKTFIRESDWAPRISSFAAQGSWAHKTIIRPQEGSAFDADLLVYVRAVVGWSARDYIDELAREFRADGTYRDKCRAYSHCVTIEYARERKIDIAPCIVGREGSDSVLEVCNRTSDEFERTEPAKYTQWLVDCNSWTGGNSFRKGTRLLKYLRDIKETFTCPSVLLTTLLGYRIGAGDASGNEFSDVPTTLKTLVGRLDNWLQGNPVKPEVRNPYLTSEKFSDAWDDVKYANFREKIHTYRTWIDDAFAEEDRNESIGKWRRVFGDDFAKGVSIEVGKNVTEAATTFVKSFQGAREIAGDLVSLVQKFGQRALFPGFTKLPYMERPKWKAVAQAFSVSVTASLYDSKRGNLMKQVAGMAPLPKNCWLKFEVRTSVGGPLPDGFEVHWRVTNTDRAAAEAGQLRGGFDRSDEGPFARWERTAFRGVHIVEAFVVRRRDNALVSVSPPFFVVIE